MIKNGTIYCPGANARLTYLNHQGVPHFLIWTDNMVFLDNHPWSEVVLDCFMGDEWRKAKIQARGRDTEESLSLQ